MRDPPILLFMKLLVNSIIATSLITLTGCESLRKFNSEDSKVGATVTDYTPLIRPIVTTATLIVLNISTNNTDRTNKTRIINNYATIIRKLAEGKTPTQQDLEEALKGSSPDKTHWIKYVASISALYGALYNKVGGDAKTLTVILRETASAIEEATSPSELKRAISYKK